LISLLRAALVTVLYVAATTSCTASYPTEPTKARPVALYLAYAAPKGRAAQGSNSVINGYSFTAYTLDADGVYENVSNRATWSSSDEGIVRPLTTASSSLTKSFLAVSPGSASVIARFQGLEATAPMLIVESALISTRPYIELLWSGQNAVGTLSSARVLFRSSTGANQDVTGFASWTSSNPEVATVDRGTIRAVSSGTTIITANIEGLVDWFWFSVVPKS
jgi:hypothetical protein